MNSLETQQFATDSDKNEILPAFPGWEVFTEVGFSQVTQGQWVLLAPANGSAGFLVGVVTEKNEEQFSFTPTISSPPTSGVQVIEKDQTEWKIHIDKALTEQSNAN